MGVYTVQANIFSGARVPDADSLERLVLSRAEMQKARLRRRASRGTDVMISLETGARLHNGDVLAGDGGRRVLVEQSPERVIAVTLPPEAGAAALLGHIIGNRHRPISIEGRTLRFPIQADSELETFEGLLAGVGGLRLGIEEAAFEPVEGADVHAH